MEQVFGFRPEWKEKLVVTGPGGSFVLEYVMGDYAIYLPTEEVWPAKAPAWAAPLWATLKRELEDYCQETDTAFHVVANASASPAA